MCEAETSKKNLNIIESYVWMNKQILIRADTNEE